MSLVLICVANVNLFSMIKLIFFPCQVITVALRCPDGAVQKRRFTVESQIKVLTLTSLFIYSVCSWGMPVFHVRFMIFVSSLF